jgi:hypothetical protein
MSKANNHKKVKMRQIWSPCLACNGANKNQWSHKSSRMLKVFLVPTYQADRGKAAKDLIPKITIIFVAKQGGQGPTL